MLTQWSRTTWDYVIEAHLYMLALGSWILAPISMADAFLSLKDCSRVNTSNHKL